MRQLHWKTGTIAAATLAILLTGSTGQLLTIADWLDVNFPYHPSCWGRVNVKYQEHPNYRPNVTFEEAVSETLPESIRRAEATIGETAAK